ncbi:MAG: phosphate acetyltransferase [Deltaproteobacteria bacterium]|nr:phosphate acetyltransferase [Deltaproteobacteria bacterium]
MTKSLYIAGIEPRSGKSVISLGIMEMLSRRISRAGYFRPVIPSGNRPDNNIQLIRTRYDTGLAYEEMYGSTNNAAHQLITRGQSGPLFNQILSKYKKLERKCSFILCEGTDFTGVSSAFEFDFNADVANNLGSPVLVLVNGRGKTPSAVGEAVAVARESFEGKGCTILATIVNRVHPPERRRVQRYLKREVRPDSPLWILPEEPVLGKPTVGDIARALGAKILNAREGSLTREISGFKIAAMNLPHFLERIEEGDLIITPGDRADMILGSLTATLSHTYPTLAGLLLTGGLTPDAHVLHLLEGFEQQYALPVISSGKDTYATAMEAGAVRPALSADNHRKIAAALGIFEAHVKIEELENRIDVIRSKRMTPLMFEYELIERAKADRRHIVLPEGEDDRILRAVEILIRRNVVDITLLGNVDRIRQKIKALSLDLGGVRIIDPLASERLEDYARLLFDLRRHKGLTEAMAFDAVTDVSFFGTMMVHAGDACGMVSGAVHPTGETIRPALQIIRARPGVSVVSSVFFMCLADRVLVYGDCAVNPDPDADQLADIAISSACTAAIYGIEPRVAMCSYATAESGRGKDVDKVREATRIVRRRRPELKVEGPIQYDAAIDAGVAHTKLPHSEVAGRATVFIFPDLNTGNNLYKAVQRSAGAVAIGPVLQGLNKPVNDLSRGCTVADIVNTVAITAIQAQREGRVRHGNRDECGIRRKEAAER